MFCQNCGSRVNEKAAVCLHCGCAINDSSPNYERQTWLTALLLCIFLGCLGGHRFYTGHKEIGVAQLLITVFTCATLGWIWPLIDLILLLCGEYKNTDGEILRHK